MAGTYGYQLAFTESVSAVTATGTVALLTRRQEGGAEYVYVYNGGSTAAVGLGMIQSGFSAGTVVVTSALGDRCAGVVANVDLNAASYGWLKVKGPTTCIMDAGAGVNGDCVIGYGIKLNVNGKFAPAFVASTGTGITHANQVCGVALAAIASDASGRCYVNCYL